MSRSIRILLLPLAAASLLAACKENPQPDQPASPASPVGDTQLRDAIQSPINRAKGVEGIIMKSHDRQDKQLQGDEGASSGASSPAE
jgi:hypothetical protein